MEPSLQYEQVRLWHMERDTGVLCAALEARINSMQRDMDALEHRLMRLLDGNGHPSLDVRLNNLERDSVDTKAAIRTWEGMRAERIKGGWVLITALVSGLLGLLAQVVTLIIK